MKNLFFKNFKWLFVPLVLFTISVGNAWGADSGLTAGYGQFILDFYDSSKLSSSSGTGLTNDNYSSFVKVYSGLTKTNVVTGVSVTGTVRYGLNGGLTAGTKTAASANTHYVSFSIGSNFPVRKATVYATAYESGRWKLNSNTASSGSLGSKGATFASVTSPLIWNFTTYATSLEFKKDNGSGGNQKRLTIYTIVCEYGYRAYLTAPGTGSISAAPKTTNENGAGWNGTEGAVVGLKSAQQVTLSATPPDGFELDAWTVKKKSDNSDVTASVLSGSTLTMPAYDVTISVSWRSSGCSNYSFHYGTKDASDWCGTSDYCFTESTSDGNGGKFWLLEDFTMPAKPDFYVGWQGSFNEGTAKSKTLGFSTIPFDLQRTKTIGTYDGGNTQGAIGILRIRSSYGDDNKYIGFIPGGYVLRLGSGDSWTSYAFTPASANYYETVWTTDIMTLTAGILGGNAYVGLKTSDSYVWNSTYSQSNAINGNMGQKSGTSTWGSNLSSSNDVGKRGKFRIWADNTAKNWNLHFVPYHRIIYHSNYPGGGGPADTYSTDVSVEETKSDIALPSAPTAPTGYTFAGWYDAASGGTKKTGNQTISAGASADPEYYAHWYGITLVVKDEDGTTLSGDGKPTLTRSGLSLTATTAGNYVFKDIQITSGTGALSSTSSTTPTITAISSDITVTATFYKPIAITKGTNTGAATFTLSATEVARGGNVTITCAADATHKGSPTITATSGNYTTISVASATSASVNGITGPVTINISFAAKETATVKLHVAGSTSTISGTRYEGDSYTLPSEAAECPDMGLYGWYTTDYEHETTAPSGANFKLPGASATLVAGDNDFYAVYATITPDAANTYTEITSVGQLVTGDYLIGAGSSGGYCMSNYITSSHMAERSMSVSDGVVTNSSYPDLIWHITKSGDNYTFYNADAEKYLALSTASTPVLQTSAHNFTASYTSSSWLFSSTTVSGYQLAYYVATSYFESSTSKGWNIHLFKRDPSIAGPYTTTPSCVTHTLTVEADPVAGGTAEAAKTVLGETKTTTATATPNSHYDFAYWTISGTGSTMSNTSDGKSTDNPVTITMGTANATLTAHFTEKEKCTVVFKNNGTQVSSTTYWRGENPVAPTLTDGTSGDACDATSDTHYGWTKTAWPNTIASKSTIDAKTGAETVYTKAATLPAITAGDDGTTITYHAVWAEGVGVPSNEWQLVTSTSSLETGDKVVIGHNNTGTIWLLGYQYITPDATDAKRYYNRKYASNTETVSDSKITLTSDEIATAIGNTSKPYVLTIGKSGDYWTFYDDVYEGYLYAAGTNDALDVEFYDKNLLNCQAVLTNAGKWELTINGSTGAATIVSQTTSGTTRKNLQRNGTDAGGVFSCYPSQTDPYIYKNLSTTGYQNFLTTCCANIVEAPEVTGTPTKNSITLSWTNVTGATGYTVTSSGGTPGDVSSDGTARSCVITGLSPNTNYTWSVVATYTTPYCLANTANGNTTTSQVYAVSYNKNGGTIANLPSGGTYAAGEEVTVAAKPDGTVSKGGYTFTGWNTANDGSGEHYNADGSTSFTMPSEAVVLYAEWTAKKNYFIDRMHGNWDGEHTEPTTGYNCYLREGAGYTVPDLSDDATGSNSCVSGHEHFIGWVIASKIGAQGQLLSGYTVIKGGTVQTAGTDGTIYYAVWAEE